MNDESFLAKAGMASCFVQKVLQEIVEFRSAGEVPRVALLPPYLASPSVSPCRDAPTSSVMLTTSAPFSTRNFKQSRWPSSAASIAAVVPPWAGRGSGRKSEGSEGGKRGPRKSDGEGR